MAPTVWASMDNGNIEIVSMTRKYFEESIDLLWNYYFKEEKISKIAGISSNKEAAMEVMEMFRSCAVNGISLAFVDRIKEKLIGVSFNAIEKNDEEDTYFIDFRQNFKHKESIMFVKVEENFWDRKKVNSFIKGDHYIELNFAVILPEYRGKGILRKCLEVSLEMGRRLKNGEDIRYPFEETDTFDDNPKPSMFFALCSNPASANVCHCYGFKELARAKYSEVIDEDTSLCDLSDQTLVMMYYES